METIAFATPTPFWMWGVFFGVFLALLAFDLGVLNKKDHAVTISESLKRSLGYAFIAFLFGGWIWYVNDAGKGMEDAGLFITGYLVELSLSLDNIFVISLVLTYFKVPKQYQHRVLFWGIIGVIIMRGVMIGAGTAIVQNFHHVLYLFAAFLVFTGVKMLFMKGDDEHDMADNKVVKFFERRLRVTSELQGSKFMVKQPDPKTGKPITYFTPLMLALAVVEVVDVIFAVDSIPAILAITTKTFIVYTSNLFAIMGLRSLYFTLSAMLDRFKYLKYSLALVLIFIGSKVFVVKLLDMEKFPPALSLVVTVGLLLSGALFSLHRTKAEEANSKPAE
ncbi:MAG: TerC family protein [Micavibrio sp.]|nr:TerC family protein [Micavibrio sp.]